MASQQPSPVRAMLWLVAGVVGLVLVVGLFVGGCAGVKSFSRSQQRADANNQVKITHIKIRQAQQQADIVNAEIKSTVAEANKRFQEAVGIRRAQDEISKTLTPLYIQHEAIQAEEQIAQSGRNATFVYVPSGEQGVPLVKTTP